MLITFEKEYLRQLYELGRCQDKKHRYQPNIVKIYQKRVQILEAVDNPETLYQFNSLHFEALKGDRDGRYSVRINDKYRLEFTLSSFKEETAIIICNIVELSNHYD